MSTDYTKHKDKRVNNPTIEERNFFTKEESAPYETLYPRDPSLDPQLVWKGKDEQDREALAVPTVPIYIQEKIQPQAIIEDLRRMAAGAKASAEEQPDDGESFFVRHAYFVGADKPYEKLAKTLRSEINESAWVSIYSTTSRPFPPPSTGKIAVKVINHYGDKVLKVYEA